MSRPFLLFEGNSIKDRIMNEHSLREALKDLEIGQIHFFEETDSTNERALVLSGQGAPEFTLVIAERQTAGRGRFGRRWETAPGTSLAFTVIFYPDRERTGAIKPVFLSGRRCGLQVD